MAMNFGKLNFAVGFNRTSAFPLDANSYFEDYASAETAASGAAEVGSSDSAYYIGQVIIVKDTTKGVGLYQIGADKKLVKFGQASSEADLAEKISALETRATTIEGKLILATTEADGFMSKEDKAKLDGIAEGATKVIVDAELTDDGVNPVQGKAIKAAIAQVDGDVVALEGRVDGIEATANAAMPKAGGEFTGKVSGVATADADGATTFVTKGYVDTKLGNKVDVVDGKGLSTNDYDNAAKAIVDGVTDELAKKVDKVTGKSLVSDDLVTKLEAIQDNAVIKGVEGGIKLDAETGKISVDAENIPEIAQAKVTGLVDKLSEIDTSLGTKQTADQVNTLIQDATIKGEKITGAVALATSASTADKVAHVLTVGNKAYNGSEDITITADDLGALTEIPQATESALGGIKVGYNSTSANDCPVILSAEGQAYVTIPAVPEALIKTIEDTQFEVTAGKLSLKAVSTDLLVQGSKEFILDGGSAAGDEYDF